jgi:dyslexia susceptibility 1 candidate gene 1 protein
MPILIKDFTVTQQPEKIFISVEIPNISAQKASIYCNSCYIKINYPPYFFELDLAHEINSEESSASVGEGKVVFQLLKTQANIWETIKYTLDDRLQRRQEAEKKELLLQEKVYCF